MRVAEAKGREGGKGGEEGRGVEGRGREGVERSGGKKRKRLTMSRVFLFLFDDPSPEFRMLDTGSQITDHSPRVQNYILLVCGPSYVVYVWFGSAE